MRQARDEMNDRTCIVTRKAGDADALIRFVASPDGRVTPDLKRNLPGRGCWVTAERGKVDKAVARKLFSRALKAEVETPADLGETVDVLLAASALGSLGLARKAGQVLTGAAQVEKAVRSGSAALVLHALEAAQDGVRKITQARNAVVHMEGPDIPALKLFREEEMGLATGTGNVIHVAVLDGQAGAAFSRRAFALARYRGIEPADRVPSTSGNAKETDSQ